MISWFQFLESKILYSNGNVSEICLEWSSVRSIYVFGDNIFILFTTVENVEGLGSGRSKIYTSRKRCEEHRVIAPHEVSEHCRRFL